MRSWSRDTWPTRCTAGPESSRGLPRAKSAKSADGDPAGREVGEVGEGVEEARQGSPVAARPPSQPRRRASAQSPRQALTSVSRAGVAAMKRKCRPDGDGPICQGDVPTVSSSIRCSPRRSGHFDEVPSPVDPHPSRHASSTRAQPTMLRPEDAHCPDHQAQVSHRRLSHRRFEKTRRWSKHPSAVPWVRLDSGHLRPPTQRCTPRCRVPRRPARAGSAPRQPRCRAHHRRPPDGARTDHRPRHGSVHDPEPHGRDELGIGSPRPARHARRRRRVRRAATPDGRPRAPSVRPVAPHHRRPHGGSSDSGCGFGRVVSGMALSPKAQGSGGLGGSGAPGRGRSPPEGMR
jgi:hypothetical protein